MSTANYYHQGCTQYEHRAQITNYCAVLECLRPLCPECIQEHYQYHVNSKTSPAIQSLTATRANCEKKISTAIQNLRKVLLYQNQEIQSNDVQYMFNPDEILRQEIDKMEEAKQQMIQIIEIYFQQQENILKTKVNENQLKVKNIGGVFQKITEVINQLEGLKHNIVTSEEPYQYFSKTCRLDAKLLLDKYKSELKKIISTRELGKIIIQQKDPINVHIDQHRLFQLKNELAKIVYIMTHHNDDLNESQQNKSFDQSPIQHLQAKSVENQSRNISQQKFQQTQPPPQSHVVAHVTTDFKIQRPNYFVTKDKILPFFRKDEKTLKLINIETLQQKTINLNITYTIPAFHRSLILPNGDIYISGGSLSQNQKESIIRKINISNNNTLQNVASLKVARSSHSMVYLNGSIYFIGGYVAQTNLTTSCERYVVAQNKMELCSKSNHPSNSPTCCPFNDRYIYKFGGNDNNGQMVLVIERYDADTDQWCDIDPQISEIDLENFKGLFQYAACSQISPTKIFVFGGYDIEDSGTDFSFILEIESDGVHKIIQSNVKPLPYPEGFWNSQVVVENNKLYVLQNIEMDDKIIDESNRCLLTFDGNEWKEIQVKQ